MIYPKGIILNKLNIDNQAVMYHFNFILKGDQYIIAATSIIHNLILVRFQQN